MRLTRTLAEHYGFHTVLVMTTGLVLRASPLAWMLREKTEVKTFQAAVLAGKDPV